MKTCFKTSEISILLSLRVELLFTICVRIPCTVPFLRVKVISCQMWSMWMVFMFGIVLSKHVLADSINDKEYTFLPSLSPFRFTNQPIYNIRGHYGFKRYNIPQYQVRSREICNFMFTVTET